MKFIFKNQIKKINKIAEISIWKSVGLVIGMLIPYLPLFIMGYQNPIWLNVMGVILLLAYIIIETIYYLKIRKS